MELESVDSSRVIHLCHLVRPKGQLFRPLGAIGLVNRYSFQGKPNSVQELSANPIIFRMGLFQDIGIEQFGIYDDGLIAASASNTDRIEAFVDDVLAWAKSDLDVMQVGESVRRYESGLVVKLNIDPKKVLPWAGYVSGELEEMLSEYGLPKPEFFFGAARLITQRDTPGTSPPFVLEPRVGRPFDSGVYYSAAPLRTADHIALLEGLEERLG